MTTATATTKGVATSAMIQSWVRALRIGKRRETTITSYLRAVNGLADYLKEQGVPDDITSITREHIEDFILVLRGRMGKESSVDARFRALRGFFGYAVAEREVAADANPTDGIAKPKPEQHEARVLTEDEVKALLATAQGAGFEDRRDHALIRLMLDTGIRRDEAANLLLEDVDLDQGFVLIRLGKGSKDRRVSIGDKTIQAVERYLRTRLQHPCADDGHLWLGHRGHLRTSGVAIVIRRRGREAGLVDAHGKVVVHPHTLRHTAAHMWLADGGSETALMRMMGWSSPAMLMRYAATTGQQRALAEHRQRSIADRF